MKHRLVVTFLTLAAIFLAVTTSASVPGHWKREVRSFGRSLEKVASCRGNADPQALCLSGRFLVKIGYRLHPGDPIEWGTAKSLTDDTGAFWFFGQESLEVFPRIINGCGDPSRSYWFFAGGMTTVGVVINVFDTETGQLRIYSSPPGVDFQFLHDTDGFKNCPS